MDIISYALSKKGMQQSVSDYLDEHLTNPTNPPLDTSLSIAGAAADSKAAGDKLSDLKEDLTQVKSLTTIEKTVTHADSIKDDLEWTDGYVAPNGTVDPTATTYAYSSKINVKEGDKLYCIGYTFFRFVTAYADNVAIESKGASGSIAEYTVPSGITGVVVTIWKSNITDVTRRFFHKYAEITTHNIYEDSIAKLDDLKPSDLNGISVIGGNIIDNAIEKNDGMYAMITNGHLDYGTNDIYYTVIVPIEAKKYIQHKAQSSNPRIRFAVLLDSDKYTVLGTLLNSTDVIDNTEIGAPYCAITHYYEYDATVVAENEPINATYYAQGYYSFENLTIDSQLHTYLPKEICVGVGRTIELYNDLVCLEANIYHIEWVCSVGVAYKRKFSITGRQANIGEYPITLNIYDDALNKIKSLTSVVKVVENAIDSPLNIVPIGDSLTNFKAWLAEVQTLSNGKIAYIGTRGIKNSQNYPYGHEGRSGATPDFYISNGSYTFDSNYIGNPSVDGTSNPFWDGSKFSISHYVSTQSATIGTPNAIQLLLGTNGLRSDPTDSVTRIKAIVDSITNEYPNMPIFVCNTIYRSNQDGYHSNGADGYTGVTGFQFNEDIKIMNLQNALGEEFADYANVYIVPLSVCMDRDNNFGQVEVPVNPRLSAVTETIPNECVHPQSAGYLQMADVMYSCYIAHLT